jgi:hypothetical protein
MKSSSTCSKSEDRPPARSDRMPYSPRSCSLPANTMSGSQAPTLPSVSQPSQSAVRTGLDRRSGIWVTSRQTCTEDGLMPRSASRATGRGEDPPGGHRSPGKRVYPSQQVREGFAECPTREFAGSRPLYLGRVPPEEVGMIVTHTRRRPFQIPRRGAPLFGNQRGPGSVQRL